MTAAAGTAWQQRRKGEQDAVVGAVAEVLSLRQQLDAERRRRRNADRALGFAIELIRDRHMDPDQAEALARELLVSGLDELLVHVKRMELVDLLTRLEERLPGTVDRIREAADLDTATEILAVAIVEATDA